MLAAQRGLATVMSALLELVEWDPYKDLGGDLNAESLEGDTALMVAVSQNRPECAKLLLDKGASLEVGVVLWCSLIPRKPPYLLRYLRFFASPSLNPPPLSPPRPPLSPTTTTTATAHVSVCQCDCFYRSCCSCWSG